MMPSNARQYEREIPAEATLIAPEAFRAHCAALWGRGHALMTVVSEPTATGFLLWVVLSGTRPVVLQTSVPADGEFPALTTAIPAANPYEQELHALHQLMPEGHPILARDDAQTDRLVPHPAVMALPLGPVREGVSESGHFRFEAVGEEILHLTVRLGYKHRAAEHMGRGMGIAEAALLAERISGGSSVAHTLAYAQAVEAAAQVMAPPAASWWRTVLAELERLWNHTADIALLAGAAGLHVGQAQAAMLQEELLRENAALTGHRYLRGLIVPGGMRMAPDPAAAARLPDFLRSWLQRFDEVTGTLAVTPTFMDRLDHTGIVSLEVAHDHGALGPVARAAGLDVDCRRDQPYAAYSALGPVVAQHRRGDARARFEVRVAEVRESVRLVTEALGRIPTGLLYQPVEAVAGSWGLGWAESPRGQVVYWVRIGKGGQLAAWKPRAASFHNWQVFPFAAPGNIYTDFPIIDASFALSYAGNDL